MNFEFVCLCTVMVTAHVCLSWNTRTRYNYFDCVHECNCYDQYYVYNTFPHDYGFNDSYEGDTWNDNDTDDSYSAEYDYNHTQSMLYEGTYVDCRSRNIRRIHTDWGSNVTSLKLSHNRITFLPGRGFSQYRHLHQLFLDYNSISRIHVDAFAHLDKLFYLSLSHNKLTVIKPGTFQTLTTLGYMMLNLNKLNEMPFIRSLSNLKGLSISDNQLEEINETAFSEDVQLHILDMQKNKLRSAPVSFAKFINTHTMGKYSYIFFGKNPWICDCTFSALKEVWPRHPAYLQDSFYCAFPENLKGENIWQIPDSAFVCDNATKFPETHGDEKDPENEKAMAYSGIELAGACVGCIFLGIVLSGFVYLGFVLWKRYKGKKDTESSAFVKMEETGQ